MSWSEIQKDIDGRNYQHWTGGALSMEELFTHLGKVAGGVDASKNVYISSPTTIKWDRTPAEVEADEKALLKALKAKYPNE